MAKESSLDDIKEFQRKLTIRTVTLNLLLAEKLELEVLSGLNHKYAFVKSIILFGLALLIIGSPSDRSLFNGLCSVVIALWGSYTWWKSDRLKKEHDEKLYELREKIEQASLSLR
jgi:hypothetical protein